MLAFLTGQEEVEATVTKLRSVHAEQLVMAQPYEAEMMQHSTLNTTPHPSPSPPSPSPPSPSPSPPSPSPPSPPYPHPPHPHPLTLTPSPSLPHPHPPSPPPLTLQSPPHPYRDQAASVSSKLSLWPLPLYGALPPKDQVCVPLPHCPTVPLPHCPREGGVLSACECSYSVQGIQPDTRGNQEGRHINQHCRDIHHHLGHCLW